MLGCVMYEKLISFSLNMYVTVVSCGIPVVAYVSGSEHASLIALFYNIYWILPTEKPASWNSHNRTAQLQGVATLP
jgi:hypothetical protein